MEIVSEGAQNDLLQLGELVQDTVAGTSTSTSTASDANDVVDEAAELNPTVSVDDTPQQLYSTTRSIGDSEGDGSAAMASTPCVETLPDGDSEVNSTATHDVLRDELASSTEPDAVVVEEDEPISAETDMHDASEGHVLASDAPPPTDEASSPVPGSIRADRAGGCSDTEEEHSQPDESSEKENAVAAAADEGAVFGTEVSEGELTDDFGLCITTAFDEESYRGTEPIEITDSGQVSKAASLGSLVLSSDGSREAAAVALPVSFDNESHGNSVCLPPPAPTASTQPSFIGSLNPLQSTHTAQGDEDSDSDSDSDDEDADGEAAILPPPLLLDSSEEDEKLEVDPAVAEDIRASVKANASAARTLEGGADRNPLLEALNQVGGTSKQLRADGVDAQAFKMDEIALGFDSDDTIVQVRSAQVVDAPLNAESSVAAFGIGYQSIRKRTPMEDYTVHGGSSFIELDNEVTLSTGVSLSQQQTNRPPESETDEFEEITDAASSPSRVDTILQKSRASLASQTAQEDMICELRKDTDEEKKRLHNSKPSTVATTTLESDNALTLKELHAIYKRGFGDQEVLMLNDKAGVIDKFTSAPPLSVMGRILTQQSIATLAIAEEAGEDEEDDGSEDAFQRQKSDTGNTLNDDDVHTVVAEGVHFPAAHLDDGRKKKPDHQNRENGSEEWKEVELLRKVSLSTPAHFAQLESTSFSTISYAEAAQYFLESNEVLVNRDRIIAEENGRPVSCFSCFSRPRLVFEGAIDQRDRFFCVAMTSFDAQNTVHVRMLQTIYRKLMNASNRDVPLMGLHWETIGFQGTDPSTDLRGCGVLSLLQILHLVEFHAEFARRFHIASQHPVRHFPSACALINITLQCLTAVRSGALYRECNKRSSVFDAANALHIAIAAQLHKELQVSDEEIPMVMKRVLECGRLQPDRAIQANARAAQTPEATRDGARSNNFPGSRTNSIAAAAGRASSSHAAGEFTEIGLHSFADD